MHPHPSPRGHRLNSTAAGLTVLVAGVLSVAGCGHHGSATAAPPSVPPSVTPATSAGAESSAPAPAADASAPADPQASAPPPGATPGVAATRQWPVIAGAPAEAVGSALQQRWHMTRNAPQQRGALQEIVYHVGAQLPTEGRILNAIFRVDKAGRLRYVSCGAGGKGTLRREDPDARAFIMDCAGRAVPPAGRDAYLKWLDTCYATTEPAQLNYAGEDFNSNVLINDNWARLEMLGK